MNAFICEYYCSLLFVRKKVPCVFYDSCVVMLHRYITNGWGGGWGYGDKLEIYLDTVCFHRLLMNVRVV